MRFVRKSTLLRSGSFTAACCLLVGSVACNEANTNPGGRECAAETVKRDCPADQVCSSDGRCVEASSGTALPGDAGSDGPDKRPPRELPPTPGSNEPGVCADVMLRASVVTPNVVVIVDQSGSMTANFGSGTRWTVLKDALLSDQGILAEFQKVVRLGVALFTYSKGDPVCPVVSPAKIDVAFDALPAIREVYLPAEPGDNTPTGESIDAVLASISGLVAKGPDTQPDPTIFILATDGNPDTCELPDQGAFGSPNSLVATKRSIDAVKRAYEAGVSTYVIAVADENDLAQSHVNDLANAGVGDPAAPGIASAPSYRVDNDQGLRDALREIIAGQQSCDVKVDGQITGDACSGSVALDGVALSCDDPNGWTLVDESTIRVQGKACEGVKAGKLLTAKFPCESVVVF